MPLLLGEYNELEIGRQTDFGFYLKDEQGQEVLLPKKYITDTMILGQMVKVFVYQDSEERIVATTETPIATVGEARGMKVLSVTSHGAYMDWGLVKDLFVPISQMNTEFRVGDMRTIYVYIDTVSNRLAGSEKINRFFSNDEIYVKPKQPVKFIPFRMTDLGYEVLLEQEHIGMLHSSDIWGEVSIGKEYSGFVKFIREDHKIDVGLGQRGFGKKVQGDEQVIIELLQKNNGVLPYGDKSDPEDIYKVFQMSKKTFKAIIGSLYKKRMIKLSPEKIELLYDDEN